METCELAVKAEPSDWWVANPWRLADSLGTDGVCWCRFGSWACGCISSNLRVLEQLEMNISNQNSFCDKVQLAPGLTAASSRHFSVCWLMLVASTFAPNVVENTCQRTESWSQTFEHRHCEGLYEDPVHSIHFVAGQWFGACNSRGTAAARTLFCCPGQGLACSSSCNLAQMILLFEAPG